MRAPKKLAHSSPQVRTQQKHRHLGARKGALPHPTNRPLDLGLPAPRTLRSKHLSFKPPSLQHVCYGAQMAERTTPLLGYFCLIIKQIKAKREIFSVVPEISYVMLDFIASTELPRIFSSSKSQLIYSLHILSAHIHCIVLYQVQKQSLSWKGFKVGPTPMVKTWNLCLTGLGRRQHLLHFSYFLGSC